jgi:uncharacterized protein YcbX
MMRLAAIWRHPIKSHGREMLDAVTLTEGQGLPWDRRWAVAHEAAKIDRDLPAWAECVNFSRGSKAPRLMAIDAALDESTGTVTLTHPDRDPLTFRPDDPQDERRFLDWVRPLCPPHRVQPAALYSVPGRGLTDTDYPSVSILNLASNADLSAQMGVDLSPLRWRGNLWLDGAAPWAETEWPGKRLRLGTAEIEVVEPIARCAATSANPATGMIDADTLSGLRTGTGAQNFGVYARVLRGGTVRRGDAVEVLQ